MKRSYLKLHLWLKARCEKLTLRQRRIFLYSVSTVYFLCSIGLIVSAFIPEKEQMEINEEKRQQTIPSLIDTPIRRDSLYGNDTIEQAIT